ncbi:hypothetical protein SteCoe_11202 [Stentor coeruleus]|uniref:Uncharacterized protein n=1 Tax=Stentor coeruleus TaxID=5963 RepID=A0A1R2CDP0_9CILI|nr:hypothetical protein SteCoe_11202 [Stentor coeruleus]
MEDLKLPNQKVSYFTNTFKLPNQSPNRFTTTNQKSSKTTSNQNLTALKLTKSLSNNLTPRPEKNGSIPNSYSISLHLKSPLSSISNTSYYQSLYPTPGPGDYETKRLDSGPAHSFSKSPREIYRQISTPGPSDYSPQRKDHSYSSVLIGKPKNELRVKTPGPGSYYIEKREGSPIFSIGRSTRFNKQEFSPGPTDYNTGIKIHTPTCVIGKSKRLLFDEIIGSQASNPGPSDYYTETKHHSPSCIIGKSKRLLLDDIIRNHAKEPGPGSYSSTQKKHSASAFLIGKPRDSVSTSPGPAQYYSETLVNYPRSAAYSIGSSTRPNIIRNNFPGPCDYSYTSRSNSHRCIFSRSSRNLLDITQSPGPDYSPPSTLSKLGGVISPRFGSKLDVSPGPGDYNILRTSESVSFTIPKAGVNGNSRGFLTGVDFYKAFVRSRSPIISFDDDKRKDVYRKRVSYGTGNMERAKGFLKAQFMGKGKNVKFRV